MANPTSQETLMSSDDEAHLQKLELLEDHLEKPQSLTLSRLLLLTCPSLGLQVVWSLLMSNGTPYLYSLGVPNPIMSLVWLMGPVFGAFVQPILGAMSDQSRHPWGRRKPFIVCGAMVVAVFLPILACAADVTGEAEQKRLHGPGGKPPGFQLTPILAVASVFAITLAMQSFQTGVRSLIVDKCPPRQQLDASAWSMRWNVLGNLVLTSVGFADAKWSLFGFEGNAKFKTLAAVAVACIATTVGIACCCVTETNDRPRDNFPTPLKEICWSILSPRRLIKHWESLPPVSRRVCTIQLFAWMAWFPILYTYESVLLNRFAGDLQKTEQADQGYVELARLDGSFAVFSFAMSTFVTSILLQILKRIIPGVHSMLPRIWLVSQGSLACCLVGTFLATSGTAATIVTSLMGVSWAVAMWIPFALISAEISSAPFAIAGGGETGWVMGLHNMAMSLPQIASALAS
ncbi:hypothetical protein QIS74_09289 [Colletotrichum tabaci]|uniref:Sucrose transporter n=1 Tax=Colletotrichum tabaci TaxID=1209068 RepID=A0AAV9T4R7_9PEZI